MFREEFQNQLSGFPEEEEEESHYVYAEWAINNNSIVKLIDYNSVVVETFSFSCKTVRDFRLSEIETKYACAW